MPTTKDIGNRGEDIASVYLADNNFKILDRNWKTRWCEIDIVAIRDKIVYFVEVKYRKTADYGEGMDYVTRKKLEQMSFAANFWAHSKKYGGDMILAVISIDGESDTVEFIEVL